MIIDQFGVLTDKEAITNGGFSKVIPVFPFRGRGDNPINIYMATSEAFTAATAITVTVQESDSDTAGFADIGSYVLAKPDKGAWLCFSLPKSLKKPFVRLKYNVTGTATPGKLFAAVTGNVPEFYEKGLYLDGKERQ